MSRQVRIRFAHRPGDVHCPCDDCDRAAADYLELQRELERFERFGAALIALCSSEPVTDAQIRAALRHAESHPYPGDIPPATEAEWQARLDEIAPLEPRKEVA